MKATYQRRQLAAIMFTDIVGYTTLMGNDEDRAFELLRRNRELHKEIIEKHDGSFLKEMGDGILSSFPTVSEAVYCSLELQQHSKKDKDLSLRIGIHSGEVVFEGKDVFGDGVNIASRIADFAKSGHILVSETVYRELGNKKGIDGKLLEKTLLKNVKNPINIYWINDGTNIRESEKIDRTVFSFREELKRRSVPKVLITYVAVSLVLLQLAKLISSAILLPVSFFPVLYILILFGLPCAIVLAWMFEWSPSGFIRITSERSLDNLYKPSLKKPLTNNWILAVLFFTILILYGFLEFYQKQAEVNTLQVNQQNLSSPTYLSAFTTSGGLSTTPSWSPDGKYIAYASNLQGSMDIYIKPIEGKESIRLTSSNGDETHPSWSLEGKTIIYSTENNNSSGISIINSEGGNSRQILTYGSDPLYSNDGRKISFGYNNDVYVYDLDSRDTLKLADGALLNPSCVWTNDDQYWSCYL